MKKYFICLCMILSVALFSCKESTLNPTDNNNNNHVNDKKITNKLWYFDSTASSGIPYLKWFIINNGSMTYSNDETQYTTDVSLAGDTTFFTYNDNLSDSHTMFIINSQNNSLLLGKSVGGQNGTEQAIYRNMNTVTDMNIHNKLTIAGTIYNPKQIDLGPNPKIYIVWVVSSGSPDYAYIWGEGTVNGNNFTLSLNQAPDPTALNSYSNSRKLGVGMIFLSKTTLPFGKIDEKDLGPGVMLGAIEDTGIIYRLKNYSADNTFNWRDAFNEGYGMGTGWYTGGTFDWFKPVLWQRSDIQNGYIMKVDTAQNSMKFPNWT